MARCIKTLFVAATALALSAASQASAKSEIFTTDPNGALTHSSSGLRFPEDVAGFRRTQSSEFDERGEYVGIRYVKPLGREGPMELRIAVVRIPQTSPKQHYTITKPMALAGHSNVRTVAEGPYRRGIDAPGYRGLFTAVYRGRPTMVGLWAFERGQWDLRARAEFPAKYRVQAEEAIGDFVNKLGAYNRKP